MAMGSGIAVQARIIRRIASVFHSLIGQLPPSSAVVPNPSLRGEDCRHACGAPT